MASNKFGYAEIVQTLSDLITAVVKFILVTKGPFDVIKFLGFSLEQYPKLKEAYEDFGTFLQELTDLTGQEALNAVGEIEAKVPDHPVSNKAVNFLKAAAITYDFGSKTWADVKRVITVVGNLLGSAA